MPRHALHRWSIVLLLIARLVLGEIAHSMPHQLESRNAEMSAATSAYDLPCPDHAAASPGGHGSNQPESLTSTLHDPTAGKTHCCQSGCDCACVHLSALGMPAPAAHVAVVEDHSLPAIALAHTPARIFLLFRPPA